MKIPTLEELDKLIIESDRHVEFQITEGDDRLYWELSQPSSAKAYIVVMHNEILELKKQIKELQENKAWKVKVE